MPEPDRASPHAPAGAPVAPATPGKSAAEAFEEFYRNNLTQLIRFLVLQGAPVTDAAEIAQDTLADAYPNWDRLTNPRAWSYRVASRAWIRRATSNREDLAADPPEPSPALRATPTNAWHIRHELITALATLPPRQRQVMAWTFASFTPEDIATELKLTSERVRANLRLARRALARRLAGGEDTEGEDTA